MDGFIDPVGMRAALKVWEPPRLCQEEELLPCPEETSLVLSGDAGGCRALR